MTTPVVSVALITYNHEQYIEQAVQSVLEQQTPFPIEILVGEDCSTDGTRAVLERLDQQHPGRLTLLPRPKNLGLSGNLQDCRERARGRYLAVLEGDDYWIDPLKLKKQHDAMEMHPDWSMCFGACRVFYEDGSREAIIKPNVFPSAPLGVDDFLQECQIQTMSVTMYRQGIIERTPMWHSKLRIGDWALAILHANVGPIGFVPEVLTAYRAHAGGLWSGLATFRQWEELLALFGYLESHFDGELATKMKLARENVIQQCSDRVNYLERVERRYLTLKLDRVAAACRWLLGRGR
ncbi:putative glycosyltransferase EpsE [Novipirellula aureliae]|uniref:Putative glycosyltransferase EpsE n=1 Tax=Novipirellula aureliae TaxID=2527966 RepID=A0A5C6DY63_9BACT|nr:glycosyltransferase [Novipirellula aureliae]TWU41194.1 putative glycosyltransferase EpsE [Novipirellula aureliae]